MGYNVETYLDDMTILFVDDEDGVRSSYEMLLGMWARKAYSASNGEEGLELFKKHKPDIVVTDIKMPVMSGLEMAKYIKEISPNTPIIITTAHQEPELLLDAVELHIDGYIVKPIPKKALKNRLETIAKSLLFDIQREKQDNLLKNIIDSSLEAVIVYKGDKCINVNNEAVSMFGFENKSDMIGKDNYEQIGKTLECLDCTDEKCDVQEPYETTLYTKDGTEITALVRCKHIIISNEELKIVNAVDLRNIKKLESEAKRKDEIMVAQSRHAAMGEMISMIAHQWRQPISAIAMGANNILADIELEIIEEKTLEKTASDIISRTQDLSKTIDDFRNFFKPGKEVQEVSPEEVLHEAFNVIGKSIENHGIEVIIDSKNGKKIKTYLRELMQVIINILKNAKEVLIENEIKEGKIFIYIRDLEDEVIISICDNGGGVKDEIKEKIFNPYFTTKDERNGTGLGLYMSRTIVEKHLHGMLNTYNENGGACFQIRLPLVF